MTIGNVLLFGVQTAIERLTKIKQDKKIDQIYATVILDRACGLVRDYVMYYDLARHGRDLESTFSFKSYSGWRDALECLKQLYSVANDVRTRHQQLLADPYYNIDKQWKPVLNRWIKTHNEGVPDPKLRVDLLP